MYHFPKYTDLCFTADDRSKFPTWYRQFKVKRLFPGVNQFYLCSLFSFKHRNFVIKLSENKLSVHWISTSMNHSDKVDLNVGNNHFNGSFDDRLW
jgi:hypothetical protein